MYTTNFKITDKRSGTVIGTGSFKSSKELTEKEKLDFFHQYTSGAYDRQSSFLSIEIN